jgi:Uncharacterized conserved protein
MKEVKVLIHTDYIKLESLLKLAGICLSGGEAKQLIGQGQVQFGGEVCLQRGKKCRPGDQIEINSTILLLAAE